MLADKVEDQSKFFKHNLAQSAEQKKLVLLHHNQLAMNRQKVKESIADRQHSYKLT